MALLCSQYGITLWLMCSAFIIHYYYAKELDNANCMTQLQNTKNLNIQRKYLLIYYFYFMCSFSNLSIEASLLQAFSDALSGASGRLPKGSLSVRGAQILHPLLLLQTSIYDNCQVLACSKAAPFATSRLSLTTLPLSSELSQTCLIFNVSGKMSSCLGTLSSVRRQLRPRSHYAGEI